MQAKFRHDVSTSVVGQSRPSAPDPGTSGSRPTTDMSRHRPTDAKGQDRKSKALIT